MNRYLETTLGGIVSAYNLVVGVVGLKWSGLMSAFAVADWHATVNAWLSTTSLVIGITAGVLTIRNARRRKK